MSKEIKAFYISVVFSVLVLFLIVMFGGRLDSIDLLPDQGAAWYYWKLPVRDSLSMFIVWGLYLIHQVVVWILIYKLQKSKQSDRWPINVKLLVINGIFILIHLLQTHIWYDGLAQDVPVWSSQGSVIIMLILVLIMEIKRRGLFLGKKINGFDGAINFVRRYHGYFIAWAIIYTFWYHPTINTSGHLFGFFYMFLLFIQLSLTYTKIHTNIYFNFVLEVLVLVHGTTVAINQGQNMWPMFLFGFAFVFVVTQVYGLKLSKWGIRLFQLIYIIGVIVVFGGFTGHRTIGEVHQILWIPIIDYLLVFILLFGIEGIKRIHDNLKNNKVVSNNL